MKAATLDTSSGRMLSQDMAKPAHGEQAVIASKRGNKLLRQRVEVVARLVSAAIKVGPTVRFAVQ